ncbi:MAG: acyl carrier protein [Succinivibrio sp.]|nr:acyl carrier protein [Succinivibrio sp.]
MSEVKDFLLSYFKERFDDIGDNLAGVDLIEDGYIDSMALYSFVAKLEDQFDIQFSDEELLSHEFRKLDTLAKLVEKKITSKK